MNCGIGRVPTASGHIPDDPVLTHSVFPCKVPTTPTSNVMVFGFRSPVFAAVIAYSCLLLSGNSAFAQVTLVAVDLKKSSQTSAYETPAPPFGSSYEPGGSYTCNGATLIDIKVQLSKKDQNQAYQDIGQPVLATWAAPDWSAARYKNLADGEYKVKVTLTYTVAGIDGQKTASDTATFAFFKPKDPDPTTVQ